MNASYENSDLCSSFSFVGFAQATTICPPNLENRKIDYGLMVFSSNSNYLLTIVHFISVGSWSDSANISSGCPWWIFFGFFANERQHFETNRNEKKSKK